MLEGMVILAGAFLGGVVWAVRLEGRVHTQEQLHIELRDGVERLEGKIDRLTDRIIQLANKR